MASITQTIPQYSLGMSEQPDNLKFPGQVTEVTNAIPDLTRGLFKRPGAKRVGTSPLSSVQSGGSWFHYFRDESEGSYIGQVAADGQVRIWSCKTGALQTTVYGTGGQTAIQNYLQTATPENLQFLTINDTTFVSNRDASNYTQAEINAGGTPSGISAGDERTVTAVGHTGLTAGTPHTYYGFIELLRTENGRQYGVNINNGTTPSTLKRATKIKITDHTFDETDGSGHCPGIGTEVYTVTAKGSYTSAENITHVKDSAGNTLTSGRENLVFRITALGQQGVSPDYTANDDGAGGQNYRCSYNIEAVLLHGGEGWELNDVVRVIPEHAQTASTSDGQAHIDVTVTEVEQTQVNATVASNDDGLIRPSPTPFDAETAVTADTILGGLKSQIDAINGIDCTIIGTGIYVFSNTQAFSIDVVEEDLMRCFQSSVNDVQNLPNQCKDGYIVKIANSRMSDEDDYYLKFESEQTGTGKDSVGSWSECAKPQIAKTLTNMPLVIQRTATNTFTVKQFTYEDRLIGDDRTNPLPSFVETSDGLPKSNSNSFVGRINKVLFFRNRLAFLSGENVILSRPGSIAKPDFFAETALTVSASDPIDISAASTFPSELFDGIDINTGLLVFSTNQQFLLSSDDTVLNPDTAKLRSVSTFNYNEAISPISLGTTVAYVDNSGKFSRFNEMANIRREGEPNVVEVSKIVPTLLPKDIDLLTNSRENSMVLLGKTNSDTVFGYKYFQVSEQRQQAAWFKWKFNNPLIYHFIINDEYYFLDTDYYLQCIKLVQTELDPSTTIDNVNYLLHLDNHTTVSGGNFSSFTNLTTFSGVGWLSTVTTPNHKLVVIDEGGTPAPTPDAGRYAECTVSGTSFTVPGNWQNVTLTIGYLYPYEVKFPTFYPTKQEGNSSRADVNSSLIIHRLKFHFGKIGLYKTTLKRVGKVDYSEVYESIVLTEYDVSDTPYVEEYIKTVPVYERNTNVDVVLESSHPAPATLRSVSWEGDYTPRYYKRV